MLWCIPFVSVSTDWYTKGLISDLNCRFDYKIKAYFVYIISLGSFPDNSFGFRLELADEYTEIVPSVFGRFIGYHQGIFACFKVSLTLQKLRKHKLGLNQDADHIELDLKPNGINGNRILNKKTKSISKHCRYFQK